MAGTKPLALTRVLALAALLALGGNARGGIESTLHNLSTTGSGSYTASTESQICIFCHAPHNANPAAPLWNHELSGQTYTPYSSSTAAASPGQPTGTSRLCLSCHDGTVALGSVHNLPWGGGSGVVGGLEASLSGSNMLSTDLSDDHPISFVYDASLTSKNSELLNPSSLSGAIKLDQNGELQCATCHDAHSDTYGKFLRLDYTDGAGYGSPLCLSCHNKDYWSTVAGNPHRESLNTWNGVLPNPWHLPGHDLPNDLNSTPKANGCENCHKPHSGGGGRLLLKQDGEAGVCLVCHNGNVATGSKDIEAALNKAYVHPAMDPAYDGRHYTERDPVTGIVREPQANLANRHAECPDCHDPHAVSPGTSPSVGDVGGTNNLASNVLKGAWGVEPSWPGTWLDVITYTEVNEVQYQHQLCLKCHSYYAFGLNPPPDPYGLMTGDGSLTDQAKEFNPNNKSYHPVVAPGKNDFIQAAVAGGDDYSSSLINGMSPTSTITCAECHSDSQGTDGLKGPHGSDVWPILWAPYDETTGESTTGDHLCFKCHDAAVYLGGNSSENATGFSGYINGIVRKNLHERHVSLRQMPCTACHAAVPHGWKRRALLVYGTGTPDEAPYNGHERYPINGSSIYGLNSGIPLDTIESGTWERDFCHSASDAGTSGVTGVGSCSLQ